MVLVILLFISIVSQFFAASVAIKLTRTTKYNSSWILITIALLLMCVTMLNVFFKVLTQFMNIPFDFLIPNEYAVWMNLATSLCFAVGVYLIKKVLAYIAMREESRRRSEERVLSAIIQAEETQRLHIAKELHDGLGPLLSSARLSISALTSRVDDQLSQEIAHNAEQAIVFAVNSLKDISNNLSPHILNNFGVFRALNSFINRLRPVVQTKIIFDTNLKNERFVQEHEVIIYRVVCEAINNVIKHASAKIMIISMQYQRGMLNIEVKDDGRGFDTEQQGEGMGLSNISSRIASAKGTINISSDAESGTQITITLPVKTR